MTAIPSWEQFRQHVPEVLASGQNLSLHALKAKTLDKANLNDLQRAQLLSSSQLIAENRIAWAASYLSRVDALDRPQKGQYKIASKGHDLLTQHPNGISEKDLRPLAKVDDKWRAKGKITETLSLDISPVADAYDSAVDTNLDPTEQTEHGIEQIIRRVSTEPIRRLQGKDPDFFERVVMDLLIAIGYGGVHGKGAATQHTKDKGVDRIIDQDALGLRKVYIQAKRYKDFNSAGRPEVQKFAGALREKADGGFFITTSSFTTDATDYARVAPERVILIGGPQLLAQLVIKYGVSVKNEETIHTVDLDEDYFA
ncbi:restriction endonuclease [Bifidobacterium asteroides]|uniref:restriction endonuclease n=1 Tax=Bifidobacterium asteroides TaxID=1684 RepID=UPI003A81242F